MPDQRKPVPFPGFQGQISAVTSFLPNTQAHPPIVLKTLDVQLKASACRLKQRQVPAKAVPEHKMALCCLPDHAIQDVTSPKGHQWSIT